MSQENVETVERVIAAINARGLSGRLQNSSHGVREGLGQAPR
jgi:hypothetical protein